jgi:RNA polymerase sigma-70 factor, ECF subfamily
MDMSQMTDFQVLYEQYAGDVHRFALYLCGNPALAEDITSDTFVRLWASEEPVRLQTLKAYLFAIARHLCIDQRRAARRSVEIDPGVPEPGLSPEMQAHYKSELRTVLKLLQGLPGDVGGVAWLCRQCQCSYSVRLVDWPACRYW